MDGSRWIQTFLFGTNIHDRDDGRLFLNSTKKGGTANGLIPSAVIQNFTDSNGIPWSGVVVQTGRDNRTPAADRRFGFEVWQYQGTSDGSNKQMMKIDKSSEGSYVGMYTDLAYLPKAKIRGDNGNLFWASMIDIDPDIEAIHGVQNGPNVFYVDQMTITMNSGENQFFRDYSFTGAENIFHVIAVPYNSNAVSFHTAVYSQSSTGFRVWMKYIPGTLGQNVTITVRLLIIFEP
ncbi:MULTISPECIES: hypothetical protein [Cytobacillus]|nr:MULTISPECIES: hypothetical protein [Cytobacillus]